MKRMLLMAGVLLAVLVALDLATRPEAVSSRARHAKDYASVALEAAENGQIPFWVGPSVQVGENLLMLDLEAIPFDPADIGKPLHEIGNSETRYRVEEALEAMWSEIGSAEEARRRAESAIADFESSVMVRAKNGKLPKDPSIQAVLTRTALNLKDPATRKKAEDDFVAEFDAIRIGGIRGDFPGGGRMRKDKPSCGLGDVCPGVCGTLFPDDPIPVCGFACVNCGSMR